MLQSEFTERTGYMPTFDEYRAIESMYNKYDGDKDVFCADFKAHKKSMLNKAHEIECVMLAQERDQLISATNKAEAQLREFTRLKEYDFQLMRDKWEREKQGLENSMRQLQENYNRLIKELNESQDKYNETVKELWAEQRKVQTLREAIAIVKE